jgi:histidinol-phosphate aminotransferase
LAVLDEACRTLHRYPDGAGYQLRTALAQRWKVSLEQVVLGNGSDEIIGMLVQAFLSPGDDAIMADQTFVVYKLEVTAAHGKAVTVPLRDWRHDLIAMREAITPRTRLVFVCNPNNPTGTMVTAGEVESFMARVPDHVIVVFDEAYYEYVRSCDFPDSLDYVKQGRNVIVLRTFSKIYGLAGLRIGYGLTTPEIAQYANRVRPPFNTNSLAQRAALAALEDEPHVTHSRTLNQQEMAAMQAGLNALGLNPLPSETNFLYVDVGQDGRAVFEALLKKGVIVRHLQGRMLRVTIGLPDENRTFLQALKTVLGR